MTFRFALLFILALGSRALAAPPKVLDERYRLELVAEEPSIVTPIGLAFNSKGKLLVIESHTHFRPEGYKGPAGDRIRVLEEPARAGKPARFSTFFEGSTATMSIAAGPDGAIYLATRMKIFRLRDKDGDGKADEESTIIRLDTKGNYPHNGLCGLAFDQAGRLTFGLGENLGEPYRLIGSDGVTLKGGGEGGNLYRCGHDGSELERIATGFWNPFGICYDPMGRLFTVENDPDARPPCRLLHVTLGGDYGFQFRFGRAGTHPLQAWDGELPGTLPMVAGTGEAPSAVVPYHGNLWVTSWGDHRLERFVLKQAGASWRAKREVVIQGDDQFRPVGLVLAPDGSLYFSDWVDRSYPVHGKGRIWRLVPEKDAPASHAFPELTQAERQARAVAEKMDLAALKTMDPFLFQAAVWGAVQHGKPRSIAWESLPDARQRLGLLQALRWIDESPDDVLPKALADSDPDVRLLAVRWLADRKLVDYRPQLLEQLAFQKSTTSLARASVAAVAWIDSGALTVAGRGKEDQKLLDSLLFSAKQPAALRSWVLRAFPPDHPSLTLDRLASLLKSDDASLRREAVWTLALSSKPERFDVLAKLAADESEPANLRADAVAGLAAEMKRFASTLQPLAVSAPPIVRKEAARLLKSAAAADRARPAVADLDAWLALVDKQGDAEAGRRVFYRAGGAACARCHAVAGRGASLGPDLTAVGRHLTKRRLLESLLQPAREVAPQYQSWLIETADGKTRTGMSLGKLDQERKERFIGSDGNTFEIQSRDVVSLRASNVSIMPQGLEQLLSVDELRDLLAFLASSR